MNTEKKLFSYFEPIVSTVGGSISSHEALAKQNKPMNQEKILFPYFQPIIGAASGTIIGYEALARQHDAMAGLFRPVNYSLRRTLPPTN